MAEGPRDGHNRVRVVVPGHRRPDDLSPNECRGVNDVAISANVEGNYTSLVTFIDGLEHSKYFYLLKDLRLDSAATPGGGIRLQLELHTYFRT